ncbi:MAG: PQQ-binding-like beta-propeller repeat protein [Vulcanimicrobiaceae bacterium]
MFQFVGNHNAVFLKPEWRANWVKSLGAHGNGGLAIVGTTVYAESFDHRMYAFNALTGKMLWSTLLPNVIMTTPIVTMGIVIVGSGTGTIFSHEADTEMIAGRPAGDAVFGLNAATGAVIWRFDTEGEDMPSGVFTVAGTRPTFIFSNGDQHLYAISPSSGRLLWKRQTPGGNFMTSLAMSDGVVYGSSGYSWDYFYRGWLHSDNDVMANEDHTWAFDARDGSNIWTNSLGQPTDSPAVGDGLLFSESIKEALPSPLSSPWPTVETMLTQQYNQVQVIDASTGNLVWSRNGASSSGQSRVGSNIEVAASLFARNTLYQALPLSNEFAAFEPQTGKMLWDLHTSGQVKMSAIESAGNLYFGDTSGKFYIVDARLGKILQTHQFPGPFGASPCVIVGKTLFVIAGKSLYALPVDQLARADFSP